MAGKLNFKINQGETFKYTLKWLDANEFPVDMTGYNARMQVRSDIDATDVLLYLSSVDETRDGTITLNTETGEITLWIGATVTSAVTWESGVYDLEMWLNADEVTRLIEGRISVSKEVTR